MYFSVAKILSSFKTIQQEQTVLQLKTILYKQIDRKPNKIGRCVVQNILLGFTDLTFPEVWSGSISTPFIIWQVPVVMLQQQCSVQGGRRRLRTSKRSSTTRCAGSTASTTTRSWRCGWTGRNCWSLWVVRYMYSNLMENGETTVECL